MSENKIESVVILNGINDTVNTLLTHHQSCQVL